MNFPLATSAITKLILLKRFVNKTAGFLLVFARPVKSLFNLLREKSLVKGLVQCSKILWILFLPFGMFSVLAKLTSTRNLPLLKTTFLPTQRYTTSTVPIVRKIKNCCIFS